MAAYFRTFDYMKKFQCLGPDCEDTCCSGWKVNLFKKDYTKIKKKLDAAPTLAPYRKCLTRNPSSERCDDNYGALDFSENGQCGMMVDGWCLLHRDFGEKMLPTVCATFPRLIYERAAGWEVHGRLSCPEVARLCLLAPVECHFEDDDKTGLPEIYETNSWVKEPGGYFKDHLEMVSGSIRKLVWLNDFTAAEKSYFVLYLCSKLAPFYYMGVAADPMPRLERTLTRMEEPAFLERVRENLTAASPSSAVRNLILAVANARLQGDHYARYNALCLSILKSYGAPESPLAQTGVLADESEMAMVWGRFLERRGLVLKLYGARVERYYANFAMNYWSQALFVGNVELDTPAKKWLFYYAFTRFLFFSHPKVVEVAESQCSEELAGPVLDAAIVEVVQIFMKTIDANLMMLNSFLAPMETLGLKNLTQLTGLLCL